MHIHHTQQKKAQRLGFSLTVEGEMCVAHWPKYNQRVWGVSVTEAIAQMEAMQQIFAIDDTINAIPSPEQPRLQTFVKADRSAVLGGTPMTPHAALQLLLEDDPDWHPIRQGYFDVYDDDTPGHVEVTQTAPKVERNAEGIPLDGGVAYREGVVAADCPYDPENEDEADLADAWYTAWDAAADEAPEKEVTTSVVAQRYREIYAERGHPAHCGDWMAEILNNLVLTPKGTDLERFEAICAENGVDLSKYKRTGTGWQGRLRMTGRNLLAKRVYLAGGVLKVPAMDGEPATQYRAPADWMQNQRYNMPKAEQAKPIPQPAQE